MDDIVKENVSAKEAELHATYDERLRNYEERCAQNTPQLEDCLLTLNPTHREKDLQRQVTVARSQLRELRTTADSSQAKLFDHSQRQGALRIHCLPKKLLADVSSLPQTRRQSPVSPRPILSPRISSAPTVASPRSRGGTRSFAPILRLSGAEVKALVGKSTPCSSRAKLH